VSNGHKCNQCIRDISPGETPTFSPDCPRCQEKVRLGMRTGIEPAPQRYRMGFRKRMEKAAFDAMVSRRKTQRAAEWAATMARPRSRFA